MIKPNATLWSGRGTLSKITIKEMKGWGPSSREGTTVPILDSYFKWGHKESSLFMLKRLNWPPCQVQHRTESIIP